MQATYCEFKRDEDSDYEVGIVINKSVIIIDRHGEPVKTPIYTYHTNPWRGSLNIPDEPEHKNRIKRSR